ncbi:MAG: indole-3-glycerol phosphate synthase TrpC [Candidatus Binatia bacterium]
MILDDIVAARRLDLEQAKQQVSIRELEQRPGYAEPRRGFAAALRAAPPPAVIAEVKKASPSKGVIRADFDPVAIARSYAAGGATALSVLTEERFFQGRLDYLTGIRAAVPQPLLRKDFLFDPYQMVEARAYGADAALLIVAMLPPAALAELLAAAAEVGLDVLTEAHTAEEVDGALAAGARIVGVNNRNLHTFVTTLATAEALRPRIPDGVLTVAESGIESHRDIERLRACGYDAFLVGESLMRAPDPGVALRILHGGGEVA